MVIVHTPAAVSHFIGKIASGTHIVLGHGVGTHITAAFALAGQHADPVQLPVPMGVPLRGIVFQIIPHAIGQCDQLIAYFLRFTDGITRAAQFQIPEVLHGAG